MEIVIRHARQDEVDALTNLAYISKAYWGYPKEYLEAWRDELSVTPEIIANSISLVAELNGKVAGFWCRSIVESKDSSHGLLFVHPRHIRKGVGRLLFDALKKEAIKRGLKYFTFETDAYAAGFYIKMGAVQVGEKESTVIPGKMWPILQFRLDV